MSFCEDARGEIFAAAAQMGCEGCAAAMLGAAILASGGVAYVGGGRRSAMVASGRAPVVRMLSRLSKDALGEAGELRVVRTETLSRKNRYELRFAGEGVLQKALPPDAGAPLGVRAEPLAPNPCCQLAALRALFLMSGYVAEPQREYHMEIALRTEALARFAGKICENASIPAKMACRRSQYVVYLKGMDAVADALVFLGAPGAMLKLQATGAVKSVSNAIHRQLNCDSSNIDRALKAAEAQVRDIELIARARGLSSLSEPLIQVARARLDAPNAPLSELGEGMNPPISKSSVNSRMRRLTALAARLREEGSFHD